MAGSEEDVPEHELGADEDDDEEDEDAIAPRAATRSAANPYDFSASGKELKELERALGAFTIHRVVGMFCAVASLPTLVMPQEWLAEIMAEVQARGDAQLKALVGQLMNVYGHVIATLEATDIDVLVPEIEDVEACREWARGYSSMLARVDPAQMDEELLDAGFAIQALAGAPHMLPMLDRMREERSREDMLREFRETLADDAHTLHAGWAEDRARQAPPPPAQPTIRRDAPKVGRNDPCTCGSGKKYKKCCGAD